MSGGTFNSLGNAYGVDPISYNQRQHQERLSREAFDARITRFIGRELEGRSFVSLDSLLTAACKAGVAHQGRALSDDQHQAFTRSCRAIWAGLALRADLGRDYSRRDGVVTIYRSQDRAA